jgi:hypothetical protein
MEATTFNQELNDVKRAFALICKDRALAKLPENFTQRTKTLPQEWFIQCSYAVTSSGPDIHFEYPFAAPAGFVFYISDDNDLQIKHNQYLDTLDDIEARKAVLWYELNNFLVSCRTDADVVTACPDFARHIKKQNAGEGFGLVAKAEKALDLYMLSASGFFTNAQEA